VQTFKIVKGIDDVVSENGSVMKCKMDERLGQMQEVLV